MNSPSRSNQALNRAPRDRPVKCILRRWERDRTSSFLREIFSVKHAVGALVSSSDYQMLTGRNGSLRPRT